LHRLGILEKMQTELPEVARPTEPKVWKQVNSFTIAFGHGVSTTPLQAAVGCAALVNGGFLMQPTFLVRSQEDAMAAAKKVVTEKTVEGMRYLYSLNAEKGSARNARVPGYRVGG
ncbi:penicillin-binding protein 2, partial [Mesorhizobium sp. M2D.F.Ca.ET.145.01.1.1]